MSLLAGKVRSLNFKIIDTAADANLVAAKAGYHVRVLGLTVKCSGGTAEIEDTAGALLIDIEGTLRITLPTNLHGWAETPNDLGVQIDLSATNQCDGNLVWCYVEN